tara:strand:- start:239 stop:886 length:648 start_codon:yes stop_codon:yes gene_type:complete
MLGNNKKVIIIDYQLGNISSVINAVKTLGFNYELTNNKEKFEYASHIILPGVGSFKKGMENINNLGLKNAIKNYTLKENIPFLGICLGMQLLATEGYEAEDGLKNNKPTPGLDLIRGKIIKLESKKEKLPHIGWNNVKFLRNTPLNNNIRNDSHFYFIHSWVFECEKKNIISTTEYGSYFTSIVGQNNIYGTQFHPEKSLDVGLGMLNNFLHINA